MVCSHHPLLLCQVSPMGPGWRINAGFSTDGFVTTEEFARWWAAETAVAHVAALMTQQFPGAVMTERHGDSLSFKLPKRADMRLSDMFGRIEFNKAAYNIAEYSLSQTSLEQIFNEFASQQVRGVGMGVGVLGRGSCNTLPTRGPMNRRRKRARCVAWLLQGKKRVLAATWHRHPPRRHSVCAMVSLRLVLAPPLAWQLLKAGVTAFRVSWPRQGKE